MKTEPLEEDVECHSGKTMAKKGETWNVPRLIPGLASLIYLLSQALCDICFQQS